MPLGRPPKDERAPDGVTIRSRSVALEPHLDAMVEEHRRRYGLESRSAAMKDLIQRGLHTLREGLEGETRAQAYREAARQVKFEAHDVVTRALEAWVRSREAAVPRVKVKR